MPLSGAEGVETYTQNIRRQIIPKLRAESEISSYLVLRRLANLSNPSTLKLTRDLFALIFNSFDVIPLNGFESPKYGYFMWQTFLVFKHDWEISPWTR